MATAGWSSIHRTLAIGVFVLALIVVAVLMLTPGAALPKTNILD
jgi:hypothetical protein